MVICTSLCLFHYNDMLFVITKDPNEEILQKTTRLVEEVEQISEMKQDLNELKNDIDEIKQDLRQYKV